MAIPFTPTELKTITLNDILKLDVDYHKEIVKEYNKTYSREKALFEFICFYTAIGTHLDKLEEVKSVGGGRILEFKATNRDKYNNEAFDLFVKYCHTGEDSNNISSKNTEFIFITKVNLTTKEFTYKDKEGNSQTYYYVNSAIAEDELAGNSVFKTFLDTLLGRDPFEFKNAPIK